jgi:3-hydroxyisobutyrate dehydrogenase-like beta-hydroxyacid dehydrogenase
MLKLGFIGLGNMGEGMAHNLARAGFPLTVRDLRPEPIARLASAGAVSADSNFEVGRSSDVVSIAVFSEDQVRQTCLPHGDDAGLIAGLPAGGIIAIHSTVPASLSRDLTNLAAPRGIRILDAPMTGGGEVAAREGKLTFFVGGDAAAFERCKPAFEAMTSNLFHVGSLGAGAAAKIMSNFLAISNTIVVREALRLARGFGIPERKLLEIVNSGGVGSSWVSNNWQRICEQEAHYTTGKAGMVAMASKDLHLAQVLARETQTSMPVLSFLIEQALPDLNANSLTG